MGADGYDHRLQTFKGILLCVSLVHLASVTVWAFQKAKCKGGF
jgi:hypothetical protein